MATTAWLGRLVGRLPETEDDRHVLELRVHGVNNTPPPALLDLPPADVAQVSGDGLGSFWRPNDAARARLRRTDRGWVPPGVEREAYSWGGLARTSPSLGSGALRTVASAVARTGWALLVPFGLVNVAFWSRRLDPARAALRGWQDGRSAAGIRVFAFGLTLLLLGSVAAVSLDLVAHQCFAGGERWCGRLPAAFDGLADLSDGQRLAVGTLAPMLVLGVLVALAALTRARYEQLAAMPAAAPVPAPGTPALATPGFWANARLTATAGRVNLAGGAMFLVLVTAWHQVVGAGPCATAAQVVGPRAAACWAAVLPPDGSAMVFLVTGLAATLGLALAVTVLSSNAWGDVATPDGRPARVTRWAGSLLLWAGVLLLIHLVALALVGRATVDQPLLGLVATPALLVVVLLVIALRALGWRRASTAEAASQSWGGRAPGVFLLLSLGSALTLSSVLVVTAGDWLNGSASATDLLRGGVGLPGRVPAADRDPCVLACEVVDPRLSVPSVYVWFGVATVVALVAVVTAAAVAAMRTAKALPAAGPLDRTLRRDRRPGGVHDELVARPGARAAVLRTRRLAAIAHRGEPIVGVLALASGISTTATVVWAAVIALWPRLGPAQLGGAGADGWLGGLYAGLVDAGVWAAALVGLTVVLGMVGGAASGRARPLGLAWDLICLLPRTGHPFGPPCYAERVVPELVRRYGEWLDPRGDGRVDPARRVVVSAHSLGAVLVVASLFAARAEHGPRLTDQVSLLTYGTQLRQYFGRMFPELFGPQVLGTPPGRSADLDDPDPWAIAVAHDAALPTAGPPPPGTLRGLLTRDGRTRWLSLWRRTDYLGFPVDRFGPGSIDRPAEEVDTSGYLPEIATHSGYPRSGAYAAALADLVGR